MSRRYLLDTNVLSHLVRDPRGPVAQRLANIGDAQAITSVVVASELRFGVYKKGSSVLAERVDRLLEHIEVAPLESGVDRIYAEVRHALESSGRLIGANDLLIAAHTLAQDATLVTDNVEEFRRVPGLTLENWVRPTSEFHAEDSDALKRDGRP